MKIEFNIPDLVDLKKTYDEDGYNHIPELFSSSDMDILNKEFGNFKLSSSLEVNYGAAGLNLKSNDPRVSKED